MIREQKNINAVASGLLKSGNPINPSENLFGYLWLVNCILYSVVVALYISKGKKKQRSRNDNMQRLGSNKAREAFDTRAREIRRKLSKAKAGLERIRFNIKITKKGKKNRAQLLKEYKTLSVANLVAYMEKEERSGQAKIRSRAAACREK